MFNKNADIVPGVSLGGCNLRSSLLEIEAELRGLDLYRHGGYFLHDLFEARYDLMDFSLSISVDVRNGKIFRLCALEGYEAKLFAHIYPGQLVSEAMKLDDRIYYDEPEAVLFFKDCPGVMLDVGDDPPAAIVPQLTINAICVFVPEVFDTWAGSTGIW